MQKETLRLHQQSVESNNSVDKSKLDETTATLSAALNEAADQLERWRKYVALHVRKTGAPLNAHDGGQLMQLLMTMQECSDMAKALSGRFEVPHENSNHKTL